MNSHSNSTMPQAAKEFRAQLAETHAEEVEKFRSYSVRDLVTIFQAMSAIDEAVTGIINRPRCTGASRNYLSDLADDNSERRMLLIDELKSRPFTGDGADDDDLVETVVLYELHYCGASVLEVIEWVLPRHRLLEEARWERVRERSEKKAVA